MFAKLLAIVLTLAVTGLSLLVTRQNRIDAAHEMSTVHRRLVRHETELWELRSRLIRHIRPETISEQIDHLERDWSTIPAPASVETSARPDTLARDTRTQNGS